MVSRKQIKCGGMCLSCIYQIHSVRNKAEPNKKTDFFPVSQGCCTKTSFGLFNYFLFLQGRFHQNVVPCSNILFTPIRCRIFVQTAAPRTTFYGGSTVKLCNLRKTVPVLISSIFFCAQKHGYLCVPLTGMRVSQTFRDLKPHSSEQETAACNQYCSVPFFACVCSTSRR